MRITRPCNGLHMNIDFDSYTDFCNQWASMIDPNYLQTGDWYGCKTQPDARSYYERLTRCGSPDLADFMDGILNVIERTVKLDDGYQQAYALAPAGAFPSVPDYLSGSPECMYHSSRREAQNATRVFVNLACSASATADQMAQRGAAIVAMVRLLQRVRPVSLYAYDTSGSKKYECVLLTIPIDIETVSLPHIAAVFAHVGFVRSIIHSVLFGTSEFNGHWPQGVKKDGFSADAPLPFTRKILGCTPNDIVINGAYSCTESMTDPSGWVLRTLESQGIVLQS